jgi:hypothetical protein
VFAGGDAASVALSHSECTPAPFGSPTFDEGTRTQEEAMLVPKCHGPERDDATRCTARCRSVKTWQVATADRAGMNCPMGDL